MIVFPWWVYLATLSPTINHRDSPEFIVTAFTLGISHPAGFPLYSLLAKAFTFIPFGSLAFKVNLFSALCACAALGVLYLAALRLLSLLYPGEDRTGFLWPAFLGAGLLAFCAPFWFHALVAEVYTLHALLICILIVFLLLWRQKEDVRYLYGAALLFGLSAGNHATVAFLLPAILLLFFAWTRQNVLRHLGICTAFFCIGLSVYSYLPIRSLTEPSMDWGNPETVSGFLYQVTDRKDAATHFSMIRDGAGAAADSALTKAGKALAAIPEVGRRFVLDIHRHLTPLALAGFLAGIFFLWRKNRTLLLFFLLIVGVNITFFAHWGRESFIPTYLVVCLFTSLALYALVFRKSPSPAQDAAAEPAQLPDDRAVDKDLGLDWRKVAVPGVLGLFCWNLFLGYPKVDRSGMYFGETLLKQVYLSLENRSLFLSGMSWFNFFYHQDVTRLRDDVTSVKAWDLLDADPPGYITPRRFPDLALPEPARHRFDSREGSLRYVQELLALNNERRPILFEQNQTLLEQFPLAEHLTTYKNLLLKFEPERAAPDFPAHPDPAFEQFKTLMMSEIRKPRIHNAEWITKMAFFIESFASYFHEAGRYGDERAVLKLMHDFLGQRGLDWLFRMTDNLILDGQTSLARAHLETMQESFRGHPRTLLAEGLVLLAENFPEEAIVRLETSVRLNPQGYRAYRELAMAYHETGRPDKALEALAAARQRIGNLLELKKVQQPLVG